MLNYFKFGLFVINSIYYKLLLFHISGSLTCFLCTVSVLSHILPTHKAEILKYTLIYFEPVEDFLTKGQRFAGTRCENITWCGAFRPMWAVVFISMLYKNRL